MITILADDCIPFVSELFRRYGELILKPGATIQNSDLMTVNVLLTRSITRVNDALLTGTAVEFIGSATAGFDHIDYEWLAKQNIAWAYAPGANAVAVAEYVLHCIAFLRKKGLLLQRLLNAAVFGVGHVGRIVSSRLREIGFSVFHNDPLRAISEKTFISIPLEYLAKMDLICLHTPLTKTGDFPTYHLINDSLLRRLKPGCVLLNVGRGAVVDNQALLKNNHVIACLDVWENEPNINLDLLQTVTIGTPHIAGYSNLSKLRVLLMIHEAFLKHFQLANTHCFNKLRQLQEKTIVDIYECRTVEDILLKIYDPSEDTRILRDSLINNHDQFENLRRCYPLRQEFSTIQLTPPLSDLRIKKILQGWGFC